MGRRAWLRVGSASAFVVAVVAAGCSGEPDYDDFCAKKLACDGIDQEGQCDNAYRRNYVLSGEAGCSSEYRTYWDCTASAMECGTIPCGNCSPTDTNRGRQYRLRDGACATEIKAWRSCCSSCE